MRNGYDLNYYNGNDLVYPKSPVKPYLMSGANSEEVLSYAKALAIYENALPEYRALARVYQNQSNLRIEELKVRMREDYELTQRQFDVLWSKAWEDGHACGLSEVIYHFDELYELASEFMQAPNV
jgi:hypothetical protein